MSQLFPIIEQVLFKLGAGDFAGRWSIQQVVHVKWPQAAGGTAASLGASDKEAASLKAASCRLGLLCCTIAANFNAADALKARIIPDRLQHSSWEVNYDAVWCYLKVLLRKADASKLLPILTRVMMIMMMTQALVAAAGLCEGGNTFQSTLNVVLHATQLPYFVAGFKSACCKLGTELIQVTLQGKQLSTQLWTAML